MSAMAWLRQQTGLISSIAWVSQLLVASQFTFDS
jgi:hypothetical protein